MKNHTGVIWDLSSYFPEFNGPKMRGFMSDLEQDIAGVRDTAESFCKPVPIDYTLIRQQVFVACAVVVMDVGGDQTLPERRKKLEAFSELVFVS